MTLALDHLIVAATDLDEGTEVLEQRLGVSLSPGGQHAAMGTHNRLLGLGPVYLEVIAIDPAAPPPAQPRWYGLDLFGGLPRLTHWAARVDDLETVLDAAPDGAGQIMELSRGDLRWQFAVPKTGRHLFDGAFPALLKWHGTAHPLHILEDKGCRLRRLTVSHPDSAGLMASLPGFTIMPSVQIEPGPHALRAEIETPHGLRVIEG